MHKDIAEMTDSEKTDEILTHLRAFADILTALAQSPMARTMLPQMGVKV